MYSANSQTGTCSLRRVYRVVGELELRKTLVWSEWGPAELSRYKPAYWKKSRLDPGLHVIVCDPVPVPVITEFICCLTSVEPGRLEEIFLIPKS